MLELRQHVRLQLKIAEWEVTEMADHLQSQGSLFEPNPGRANLLKQAEVAIILAEELDGRSDPSAETAFKSAEQLASSAADLELQLRIQRGFGRHYSRRRIFGLAREHYRKAESTAWTLGREGAIAQMQVLIAEMDAELSGNPAIFKNFRKAAEGGNYSWEDRRDVWYGFIDGSTFQSALIAARKLGSTDYFRDQLNDAKRRRGETGK